MKAKLLFVLALALAAVGAGIVAAAKGPGYMTPDDELRFFFVLLAAAVLLSAACIVDAVRDPGRAIVRPGVGGAPSDSATTVGCPSRRPGATWSHPATQSAIDRRQACPAWAGGCGRWILGHGVSRLP